MQHYRTRLIIAAAMFATQVLCAAEWSMSATVDPITDQTIYHVWTFGSELTGRTGEYSPKLAIRIVPIRYDETRQRPIFEPDVFIWCPALKRQKKSASVETVLRFGSEPPTTSTWIGSDNKCALFCEDPTNTIRRILKSDTLAMRFTHNGSEQTTVFSLDGLSAELSEIKTDYLKRIGKYKAPAPVKKTTTKNTGTAGRTAPIGHNRILRNHARNQINASLAGEYDARANGYYADMKNWLSSKRFTEQTKAKEVRP